MSGADLITSVRFLVDHEGKPRAVQIDVKAWEALLDRIEDLEDRQDLKQVLPRLRTGPLPAGALSWEDVKAEWVIGDSGEGG